MVLNRILLYLHINMSKAKQNIIIFVLLSLFPLSVMSQERHRGLRQNIAVGISGGMNGSVKIKNVNVGVFGNIDELDGAQLDLFTSSVHQNVKGVNLGGLISLCHNNTYGVQLSGIANGTGGNTYGLQLCGLVDFNGNSVVGVQAAGAVNVTGGKINGLQISGIANAAKEVHGVQISGFSNITGTRLRGIQVCGVANIAFGIKRGTQVSALMNICALNMRGLQIASYNYADTLNGSQIGIINLCVHHPRGVQIGIINYSRDTIAHKIGLVNVNPNTRMQMLFYGGSCTKINLAVRFRNKSTYNIIGFGTHYLGLDENFSGALFYRVGQYFKLSPKWTISGDFGFYHIETFQDNSATAPARLYSLQLRLNVDYQIAKRLGVFASCGYGNTRYYNHNEMYKRKMLFECGFSLF